MEKRYIVALYVAGILFFGSALGAHAQINIDVSSDPFSIIKSLLPEPAKDIIDIANIAKTKLESRFGINLEAETLSDPTSVIAGSSQKITAEGSVDFLKRVGDIIERTNPAQAPDFVSKIVEIVRQLVIYVVWVARQIVEMM